MPQGEDNALSGPLEESLKAIDDYSQAELGSLAPKTVDAYERILLQVALWLAARPGTEGLFHPEDLTQADVASYIGMLTERGFSWSHRKRILAVLKQFGNWLIARDILSANPTHSVALEQQPPHGPRGLTEMQRPIVRRLVEISTGLVRDATRVRRGDLRGAAILR